MLNVKSYVNLILKENRAGALSSLITDAIYDYRHVKQHGQNEEYSGAVYRYGDNDRVENRALLVSCTCRMVGVLGIWNE